MYGAVDLSLVVLQPIHTDAPLQQATSQPARASTDTAGLLCLDLVYFAYVVFTLAPLMLRGLAPAGPNEAAQLPSGW